MTRAVMLSFGHNKKKKQFSNCKINQLFFCLEATEWHYRGLRDLEGSWENPNKIVQFSIWMSESFFGATACHLNSTVWLLTFCFTHRPKMSHLHHQQSPPILCPRVRHHLRQPEVLGPFPKTWGRSSSPLRNCLDLSAPQTHRLFHAAARPPLPWTTFSWRTSLNLHPWRLRPWMVDADIVSFWISLQNIKIDIVLPFFFSTCDISLCSVFVLF